MAVQTERKAEFAEMSKPIHDLINANLKKEKTVLEDIRKNPEGMEYKKIDLAEDMIYITTLYMSINTLSLKMLNVKNNDALNDARKIIYKSIIYLEEVVTNFVDYSYSELSAKLEKIADLKIDKRFYLVRKLGLAIQLLSDALGDNSKWKWSFVELRARYACVAKNLLDMKAAGKDYFDPSTEDYDNTVFYVRLVRQLLDKSAMDYRDKYELMSRSEEDMQKAINFLIALRRIAMILGENDESEEIKKKAQVWKTKMETDQKQNKK
ncbi:MAG: hypothetical protein IIU15_00935 [Treponema sp.]|nr:hypothetical protein [Treponema sp.]MBQ5399787.1 hypothetical protein [Treponema sp.]